MQERRVHPRFRVHVDVHYRSTVVAASAPVFDMSIGGVFVETTVPLPVGTHIVLRPVLESTEGLRVTELRGKVVRAVEQGLDESPPTPAGMGVEFEPLNAQERADVMALIEQRSGDTDAATAATVADGDALQGPDTIVNMPPLDLEIPEHDNDDSSNGSESPGAEDEAGRKGRRRKRSRRRKK